MSVWQKRVDLCHDSHTKKNKEMHFSRYVLIHANYAKHTHLAEQAVNMTNIISIYIMCFIFIINRLKNAQSVSAEGILVDKQAALFTQDCVYRKWFLDIQS